MINDKEYKALSESLAGLITVQSLLFQYLIKINIIKKDEVANALDFLIDDFNKQNPSQAMTLTMKHIRAGLDLILPDYPPPLPENQRPKNTHPDWLRGIIDGGKK